jgi:ribosomal protein S18 acetylase RimI-like enzyme
MTDAPTLLPPRYAVKYRALMLHAYAQHPDAFTSSAQERERLPLSWWESRLSGGADAAEIVIGAFAPDANGNEELAGVVGLSFEAREKARHKCTLFGMYVAAEHRRLGLGDALVIAALQHARMRSHLRLVQLTVTQGNDAAYALYERHGFVQYGLEPMAVAVNGGFVNKCHMWHDLRS